MLIFDPHIHMTSRTTDDYQRMAGAGVRAVVEPAFWLGQPLPMGAPWGTSLKPPPTWAGTSTRSP